MAAEFGCSLTKHSPFSVELVRFASMGKEPRYGTPKEDAIASGPPLDLRQTERYIE